MSYIGNTPSNQAYAPAVEYFSGNGSTTAFTLSRNIVTTAQLVVVVANVIQNPGSAFTVSGNTITFTSAPPTGTNNIWISYVSSILQVVQPTASGTPSSNTFLRGDGVWASAGAINDIFYENGQTISANYTITAGKNAITAGPVTINTGVTVTVPDGSNWVIL